MGLIIKSLHVRRFLDVPCKMYKRIFHNISHLSDKFWTLATKKYSLWEKNYIFSTSDFLNQMCYCCQKLEKFGHFHWFLCMRGRICEAVRGRERPCYPHWLRDLCQRVPDLSEPIRGARPLTASHFRPLTASASHNLSCDLSEPIRGARPLTHTASQICEAVGVRDADRPLTHTRRCSPILGAAWLISRLNALLRPVESDRPPGVRERPIGLSNLWGRVRERPCACEAVLTTKSCDLSESPKPLTASQIGLTDLSESPKWEAVWEADRPLTHTGPVAPLPAEGVRSSGSPDWFHG